MKRFDIRKKRLESSYRDIISQALMGQVQDQRLAGQMISITAVEIDDDFKHAKVYFTTLNDGDKKGILKGLNSAAPFLLSLLKDKIKIRALPHIHFYHDDETVIAQDVVGIIQKLAPEKGRGS